MGETDHLVLINIQTFCKQHFLSSGDPKTNISNKTSNPIFYDLYTYSIIYYNKCESFKNHHYPSLLILIPVAFDNHQSVLELYTFRCHNSSVHHQYQLTLDLRSETNQNFSQISVTTCQNITALSINSCATCCSNNTYKCNNAFILNVREVCRPQYLIT